MKFLKQRTFAQRMLTEVVIGSQYIYPAPK